MCKEALLPNEVTLTATLASQEGGEFSKNEKNAVIGVCLFVCLFVCFLFCFLILMSRHVKTNINLI